MSGVSAVSDVRRLLAREGQSSLIMSDKIGQGRSFEKQGVA